MSVDIATVKRVARLARIAVSEEDAERMTGELNAILGFVEQLNEVDVSGVEPMTSVIPMEMKKRAGRRHRRRQGRRHRRQRAGDRREFLPRAEGRGVAPWRSTIAVETPLQDDVRALVAELNALLIPLTPREFQFQLTVEQMAEPDTDRVRRARRDRPCGRLGALKDHGGGVGEVKRMFTLPEVRGQRVGALLAAAHRGAGAREGHRAAGAGDRRGAGLRAGLPGL